MKRLKDTNSSYKTREQPVLVTYQKPAQATQKPEQVPHKMGVVNKNVES